MKKLEQELLAKEQDNASLTHKLSIAEADLDKAEAKLSEAKHASEEGEQNKSANQELLRKVALLEDELDAAEKNLKDCNEKYVFPTDGSDASLTACCMLMTLILTCVADYDRLMSRRNTLNGKCSELRRSGMSGRTNITYVTIVGLEALRLTRSVRSHTTRMRSSRTTRQRRSWTSSPPPWRACSWFH